MKLTFADGTTQKIEVDADAGDAVAKALMEGGGAYPEFASGWIERDSRTWLNLGTIVSIEVIPESEAKAVRSFRLTK